jgi:DNA-binding Xre family transcriptional regulator
MIKLNILEPMIRAGFRHASDLVEATGLPKSTVYRYVNNETKTISLEALDKICEVLKCNPGDLIVRPK